MCVEFECVCARVRVSVDVGVDGHVVLLDVGSRE